MTGNQKTEAMDLLTKYENILYRGFHSPESLPRKINRPEIEKALKFAKDTYFEIEYNSSGIAITMSVPFFFRRRSI